MSGATPGEAPRESWDDIARAAASRHEAVTPADVMRQLLCVRVADVPYAVPVYVPVPRPVQPKYWASDSEKVLQPYDPTKSRMLTIGEGADGGGGGMRIERLENNMLRLTWRGS